MDTLSTLDSRDSLLLLAEYLLPFSMNLWRMPSLLEGCLWKRLETEVVLEERWKGLDDDWF